LKNEWWQTRNTPVKSSDLIPLILGSNSYVSGTHSNYKLYSIMTEISKWE